jgi:hypothetical protein
MKNFEIIKRGKCMFVQSISYINPMNSLIEITNELYLINYEGKVVFDLLLTNGDSTNRFLISKFSNNQFVMKSFKKTEMPLSIIEDAVEYYRNHPEFLSKSILTNSTVNEILNSKRTV